MPRTAIKFGQELQKKLQPMVAQPASSLQAWHIHDFSID
jgi:hypothetical protein